MSINKYFDHTLLKPNATRNDIDTLINEAVKYDFMSICINPYWVSYASEKLAHSDVKVCTVIGFPLGASTTEMKAAETKQAVNDGANEVDMVINIGLLKEKEYDLVKKEIAVVVDSAGIKTIVKVIIETCLLTDEEKEIACQLAKEAGADFVKTSTGFSTGGATATDIALMRKTVGPTMGVKASGGVKSREDVDVMIKAGATRIGTSSGILIVENQSVNEKEY
ncbi:deoxyribose-phosphate aldolase [Enterococcus rivorum]|uniref:Deoxyribose-phosphate aldolase n=1 Tax=Enterococcus rivorum TaxID=762845 RepID=A0A1E5KYY0_9ENTE|nr:deoxyribose-phosphate aldolase [Enterococcus rivorum]MBP2097621.1 deoxyribose-phosphate aldolase [Enterococcus rivorum]OEH83067.1 deoxyribose-phosphate aldolase [Enterococcus rivorum]